MKKLGLSRSSGRLQPYGLLQSCLHEKMES
jgi:hypothetical protein